MATTMHAGEAQTHLLLVVKYKVPKFLVLLCTDLQNQLRCKKRPRNWRSSEFDMYIHMQTIPAHGFSEYSKTFRKHSLQLVLYSVSFYEYVIVILWLRGCYLI